MGLLIIIKLLKDKKAKRKIKKKFSYGRRIWRLKNDYYFLWNDIRCDENGILEKMLMNPVISKSWKTMAYDKYTLVVEKSSSVLLSALFREKISYLAIGTILCNLILDRKSMKTTKASLHSGNESIMLRHEKNTTHKIISNWLYKGDLSQAGKLTTNKEDKEREKRKSMRRIKLMSEAPFYQNL